MYQGLEEEEEEEEEERREGYRGEGGLGRQTRGKKKQV